MTNPNTIRILGETTTKAVEFGGDMKTIDKKARKPIAQIETELENAGNELLGQLYKEHKNQKEYIEQLETKLYGQEELLRKALEKNANQKTEIEDLQEKLGSI
ncbi:8361_t:CDS:2, partial [Entrophospora sp. SA101]